MRIIGCDLHARQQTLAMLDTTTGEVVKATLKLEGSIVREFYANLPRPARVGIEATGSMQWFVNLMEELGIECLVGHPATIRAAEPRKQKHEEFGQIGQFFLRHDSPAQTTTQGQERAAAGFSLQPGNHQAVYYSYEAAGETFSGIGRAGFGNPEFRRLKIGQTLTVYYLPSAPSESCAGFPNLLIENEIPPITLAGIVFPLFAIVIYSWRYPRFKRWLLGKPD